MGGVYPVEDKRRGWGGWGWGGDRQRNQQVNAHAFVKTTLLRRVRIFSGGVWGLPREGVGANKFGMSLETREIKLFGRDIPGFCWDILFPGGARKVCEKQGCVFNFRPLP